MGLFYEAGTHAAVATARRGQRASYGAAPVRGLEDAQKGWVSRFEGYRATMEALTTRIAKKHRTPARDLED